MNTNGISDHFEGQQNIAEKAKKSYFLGPDFFGKGELQKQLILKKMRIHDKDWSNYQYGTSTINNEAVKFENEIRLAVSIGRIPVIVGLDVTTLPSDMKELIVEGKIQVISSERESEILSLTREISRQTQNVLMHHRTRSKRMGHGRSIYL